MPTKKGMMTITEAATAMGVSYFKLAGMIRSGELQAVYSGRKRKRARYVTQEAIDNCLAQMKGGAR